MRYSLLGLLGLVLFVAVSCAALIGSARAQAGSTAPFWWSTGIISLTVVLLVLCLLGTFFSAGKNRAAWAGALATGLVYWGLIFSSWFATSVGTRLFTTRVILWAEQKLTPSSLTPGTNQPASVVYANAPGPWIDTSGSMGGVMPSTGPSAYGLGGGYAIPSPAPTLPPNWPVSDLDGPPGTPFQEIAHYLLIWPLALIGALVAGWLYAKSRRPQQAATALPANVRD